MALYLDVDYSALLKEHKHGRMLSTELSGTGNFPLDRTPPGSQYDKGNHSPGHGTLILPGQTNDINCSCCQHGVQNQGAIQDNRNNFPLQSSSYFTNDGVHCNGDVHLMPGRPLDPQELESLGGGACGDVYFSQGSDPASDPECWRHDDMARAMWFMEDGNDSRDCGHAWVADSKTAATTHGSNQIQEEVPRSGLPGLVMDQTPVSISEYSHSCCDKHAAGAACGDGSQPQRSYDAMPAHLDMHSAMCATDASCVELPRRPQSRGLPQQRSMDSGDTAVPRPKRSVQRSPRASANKFLWSLKKQSLSQGPEHTDLSEHTSPTHDSIGEIEDREDSEADQWRKDPLYTNVETGEDGLYYCPFEEKEKCGHAPTNLKCNYDKFIDSHLKPHRCRVPECNHLRFSSTACRLRHERETHGSHGHGLKPYLCVYSDCERSKPGNGFPRSWNCNDHMKRVHGHIIPADSEGKPSPNALPGGTALTDAVDVLSTLSTATPRKRSGQGSVDAERGKRTRVSTRSHDRTGASRTNSKRPASELVQLQQDWHQQFTRVHQLIHGLRGPLDLEAIQDLDEESSKLYSLSKHITEESKRKNGDRPRR